MSERSSLIPFRHWFVFYIDPTEESDGSWRSAGMIGGPFTADEAIQKAVGTRFAQPFWAFALDKGDHGSYYDLHYPVGAERPQPRRIGPAGYVAEAE